MRHDGGIGYPSVAKPYVAVALTVIAIKVGTALLALTCS